MPLYGTPTLTIISAALDAADSKPTVRVATTGPITIATALNNGLSLDGMTLATGDRVLVKDQATASQNGIYVVADSPARASDSSTWDGHVDATVVVKEGTVNGATHWLCTVAAGGTLGTTSITYTAIS